MSLWSCTYCGWIGNKKDLVEYDPYLNECPECGEPSPVKADIVDLRKADPAHITGCSVKLRKPGMDEDIYAHNGNVKKKEVRTLTMIYKGEEWRVDLDQLWDVVD